MVKWIKEQIEKLVSKKVLAVLVNRLFGVITGALLAIGVAPEVAKNFSDSGSVVLLALILYVAGEVFEWYQKRK